MNLHIAPDNAFTNTFLNNLAEAGVLANNHLVVRTNGKELKHVKRNVPFAALYSQKFRSHTGETSWYDRVYIHQFTPLLYRWVALNNFNELNWAVWGADLYNLPFNRKGLYEKLTLSRFVNRHFSFDDFLYRAKVALLHERYRHAAYRKVKNILTWMSTEYEFAARNLPLLHTRHQFFFYENQLPYQELDNIIVQEETVKSPMPTYILGNSSTPELNHVDAVAWMHENNIKANLWVPVSYGDARYTGFLKRNLTFYKGGQVEFIDRYMDIREYLRFLNSSDGLIMNNIRPQGYGNIFLMMYLGKPVFLNAKNLSAPELDRRNLLWKPLEALKDHASYGLSDNRKELMSLLSHGNLLKTYRGLFSH